MNPSTVKSGVEIFLGDATGSILSPRGQSRDFAQMVHRVRPLLTKRLERYGVPEIIHTDRLRNDSAAIRDFLSLNGVAHQQVISTVRCNTIVERRAGALMGVCFAQYSPTFLHGVKSGAAQMDAITSAAARPD